MKKSFFYILFVLCVVIILVVIANYMYTGISMIYAAQDGHESAFNSFVNQAGWSNVLIGIIYFIFFLASIFYSREISKYMYYLLLVSISVSLLQLIFFSGDIDYGYVEIVIHITLGALIGVGIIFAAKSRAEISKSRK